MPVWAPAVVVATVVERDARFLFVEERVDGRLVLNQPAGHLDPGESLIEAAVRETLEETGWLVRPTALVGIYQWDVPGTGRQFLRFAFAAEPLRHDPGRALDAGIERALWCSRAELLAAAAAPRSPLVLRALDDYLAGRRTALDLLERLGPSGAGKAA